MGFFNKLFPKWEPLVCKPKDIVDLMQECLDIHAPLCNLVITYDGVLHRVGVTSDMDRKGHYFDIVFYLDEQEFETLDEFRRNALIDSVRFMELETVTILKDEEAGDPRNNILLEKRAIKL